VTGQVHREYIPIMACKIARWQHPNAVVLTCAMYEQNGGLRRDGLPGFSLLTIEVYQVDG
jgi:hypothetical protein